MGNSWDPPKWRQEGRTGPGPAAPRYKKAKDRAAVRKGGSPSKKPRGCAVLILAGIGSIVAVVEAVRELI